MGDPAKFWDRIAERYARKPVKDTASYERTLEATRKHLRPDDEVLEIGCGTGSTALRLAADVAHVTATDISAGMIEIAERKAREAGVANVDFAQAAVFHASLERRAFDAVLAFNLLHLLDDIPSAVARIHALLRPGGRFVSKTVCLGEQTRLWAIPLAFAGFLGLAPYVRCLTIAELEAILSDAGFEILETGDFPSSPPSHFVAARKA